MRGKGSIITHLQRPRHSPPPVLEIAEYWQKRGEFIEDASDIACFACHNYDEPVQRCHIVAASTGGSWEPDNFLLLCRSCHYEAPMSSVPSVMLNWARKHPTCFEVLWAEIRKAIQDIGLEEIETLVWTRDDTQQYLQFLRDKHIDFHMKSRRSERIKIIALLTREYYERRRFEQAELFNQPRKEVTPDQT